MQSGGYFGIALSAIVGGIVATSALNERHAALERAELAAYANDVADGIQYQLSEYILITEGTRAAFEADPDLSSDRFAEVVGRLAGGVGGIVNVAAAPDDIIAYVFPRDRNEAALGLDISGHADFGAAVMAARQSGRTVLSGPHDLIQGGRGLITRTIVAAPGGDIDAPERDWGIVSVVVDSDFVFEQSGLIDAAESLAVRVIDQAGEGVVTLSDAAIEAPVTAQIDVAGLSWTLEVAPRAGWSTTSPDSDRLWLLIALLAFGASGILFAFQKAARRKRRAERHLHEAVNALDDGFSIYDANDRLIMCNDRYRDIYAASAHAIVPGATFESILRAGLAVGQYKEAIGREEDWLAKRMEAHKTSGRTTEQRLPDGRWLRVTERKTESGNTVGFRVDISELKAALAKSEAASAAKTVFMNNVSHELRTPMTVVLGFNAFIRNCEKLPAFVQLREALQAGDLAGATGALDGLETELKHFGGQIDRSGRQLVDLISTILDLSSVEAGQMTLTLEPVDLASLASEVVEEFQPLADKKGLALGLKGGDAVHVTGDRLRLRQILTNLLSNALKFTDDGKIEVRTGTTGDIAWVEVEDSGKGIPEDQRANIFERFIQLDASPTRAGGGVGLGLPICRELARLHGGTVSVRRSDERGTTFRLEMQTDARQDIAAE
jgi:signal transduction histidine kinase